MATSFVNFKEKNVGTTPVAIDPESGGTYSPSGRAAVMVGCVLTNVKSPAQNVTATVSISSDGGTTKYYIAKNVAIPAGDSVEVIQGKIVLETGDDIYVDANTTDAIDVVVSILKNA